MGQGYGSLYVNAGATAQTLTTTPAKLTSLATAGAAGGAGPIPSTTSAGGGNKQVVPQAASNRIDLMQGAYRVSFSMAIVAASTSFAIAAALYLNNALIAGKKCRIIPAGSSGLAMLAISGVIEVTKTQADAGTYGYAALDVRGWVENSPGSQTVAVTPTYGELAAVEIPKN